MILGHFMDWGYWKRLTRIICGIASIEHATDIDLNGAGQL